MDLLNQGHSDGSIKKYKAMLVAKGFQPRLGIDYAITFSPIVKLITIRIILSTAVTNNRELRQLDVNNAFLQEPLTESIFMAQPRRFIDVDKPNYVCKLKKSIYGIKQAPRAWYQALK